MDFTFDAYERLVGVANEVKEALARGEEDRALELASFLLTFRRDMLEGVSWWSHEEYIYLRNMTSRIILDINNELWKLRRATRKLVLRVIFEDGSSSYWTITRKSLATFEETLDRTYERTVFDGAGSDVEIAAIDVNGVDSFQYMLEPFVRPTSEGAFFEYFNKTTLDLSKYMIFTREQYESTVIRAMITSQHCFIYALAMQGLSVDMCEQLKTMITGTHVPTKIIMDIANIINGTIELVKCEVTETKRSMQRYGNGKDLYEIALYKNHYFENRDPIAVHRFAIKNYEKVHDMPEWNYIYQCGNGYYRKKKEFSQRPSSIIPLMMENRLFEPMGEAVPQKEMMDMPFKIESTAKEVIPKIDFTNLSVASHINNYDNIVFADSEAVIDNGEGRFKQHKCFMICYTITKIFRDREKQIVGMKNGETFKIYGFDSVPKFLSKMPPNSLIVFHNLKYDFSFIFQYLFHCRICEKEGQFYKISGFFGKTLLNFVDSYKLISTKLADFEKAFKLQSGPKEEFPYEFYTSAIINSGKQFYRVEEVTPYVKDVKRFMESLEVVNKHFGLPKNGFPLVDYAKFYCSRDVEILRDGYLKFRETVMESMQLDIMAFVSISSVSDTYMFNNDCYKDCVAIGGNVRNYVQNCIYGGRVMTNSNNPYIVIGNDLDDFDGVSLYPSAMERLAKEYGYPIGIPMLIRNEARFRELMADPQATVYCRIRITKIKIKRQFPLISIVRNGIRQYVNEENIEVFVDKIFLEDLIKFQGIEYEFIDGYYFFGYNTNVGKTIRHMFEARLAARKVDKFGPLQNTIKTGMNGSYGKNGLKASKSKIVYFDKKEAADAYRSKHSSFVEEYIEYANGKYSVTLKYPLMKHVNRCHIASLILSMSKRIMNEVICTAEDNGIFIYYQDTDSMLLKHEDVPKLADAFKASYGRDLIGANLGQFHSDFEIGGAKNIPLSDFSVVISKKVHAHRIKSVDDTGKELFKNHLRCKGVPAASLTTKGKEIIEMIEFIDRLGGPDVLNDMLRRIEANEVLIEDQESLKIKLDCKSQLELKTRLESLHTLYEVINEARTKYNPPNPDLLVFTLLYMGVRLQFNLLAGGAPGIRIRHFTNVSEKKVLRSVYFGPKRKGVLCF